MQSIGLDPRAIIVHIGLHKTASTFLQTKVFTRLYGVSYLNSGRGHDGIDCDQWFFSHFVNVNPHAFDPRKFRSDFDNLLSTKKGASSGGRDPGIRLISDENLCGDIYTGIDSAELMRRLFETFGACRILVVLRNQIDYILSAYSNYVLHGGVYSIDRWLRGPETRYGLITEKVKYVALVRRYAAVFGPDNVDVLLYEDLFSPDFGLPAWLRALKVEFEKDIFSQNKVMVGRSLAANAVLRRLNSMGLQNIPARVRLFATRSATEKDRKEMSALLGAKLDELRDDNLALESEILKRKLPSKYFE